MNILRFIRQLVCFHRRESYLELVDAGLGAKRVRVVCGECGARRTSKSTVRTEAMT